MSVIYFFDLGNTRGKFWRVEEGGIARHHAAVHFGSPAQLLPGLPEVFNEAPSRVCGISVLGDSSDATFASAVRAKWGVGTEFAGVSPQFGLLINGYQEAPERLGIDRWMALIAAASERDACCVISCGTAITIDVVDHMQHKGGYILPGLDLMRESLGQGTRRVQVRYPDIQVDTALGRSTATAVCNGALAAVVSLIDRTVCDYSADRILLTGGDAPLVGAHLAGSCQLEPDLLLAGMMRYFDVNKSPPEEGSAVGG